MVAPLQTPAVWAGARLGMHSLPFPLPLREAAAGLQGSGASLGCEGIKSPHCEVIPSPIWYVDLG